MPTSNFFIAHNLITGFRAALVPFLFVYGLVLVCTYHLHQAYGKRIAGYGIALSLVGVLEGFSVMVGVWSMKRHNKAGLTLHLLMDITGAVLQASMSTSLVELTKPVYPYSLQNDCLLNTPTFEPSGVCKVYLQSDRTTGFKLAWRSLWTQAQSSSRNYQILYRIQENNRCCGFGPPLQCMEDSRSIPAHFPTFNTQSWLKSKRQTCGVEPYWYPATTDCNKIVDYDAAIWVYGGCYYDLPVGACSSKAVSPTSQGCAAAFEQHMANKVYGPSKFLVYANISQYVAIFMAFIMWLKRKDSDGVPQIYVTPDPPPYLILRMFKAKELPLKDEEAKAAGHA